MFRRIDWKTVLLSLLASIMALLGNRQLPPADPGTPPPPAEPDAPAPSTSPLECVGRLVMTGGYCSATPVTPPSKGGQQTLLSAAHCVQSVGETCQFYTRTGRVVRCTVTAIDRKADACLLQTEELREPLPYLLVADTMPPVGTSVMHCGFGSDRPNNVEVGRVKQTDTGEGQAVYLLSVSPGDSGGGICTDASGKLLSPVCCTTKLAGFGDVFGARPEVVRRMLSSPSSYMTAKPMTMPPAPPARMEAGSQ